MTLDVSDRRAATEILDSVRRVAGQEVRSRVPEWHYGVVAADADMETRKVDVRLRGMNEISPGFDYGEFYPVEGDRVRVVITPTGDRYVDAILGRDVDAVGRVPMLSELPPIEPECRGQMIIVAAEEGSGLADRVYLGMKLADDTVAWVEISTVPVA